MTKKEAVAYFGNSSKLADALGITRGAVSNWGDQIPYFRQCEIELLTDGALRRSYKDRSEIDEHKDAAA